MTRMQDVAECQFQEDDIESSRRGCRGVIKYGRAGRCLNDVRKFDASVLFLTVGPSGDKSGRAAWLNVGAGRDPIRRSTWVQHPIEIQHNTAAPASPLHDSWTPIAPLLPPCRFEH